jgi:hypothetical protein
VVSVQAASPFVGRERELAALLAGLDDAVSGRGSLFLVAGEPGIGKSRLMDEVAGRARARGVRPIWGRCWEAGGAPPYWPWVQAVRSCIQGTDRETLRAQMGSGAVDLARMVPEVRELFPEIGASSSPGAEERFQLFDATTRFLRGAARSQPIVLVLEDLHAADAPSLLLLRFLAGALSDAHLLVLVTCRDAPLGLDHAATLAELGREPVSRSILLGGLPPSDVARFIEITAERVPAQSVIAAVYAHTEGNPLFVGELVRLLVREGRLDQAAESATGRLGIPAGVRQVIGRRLGHLSAECVRILGLASVLGREFGLVPLERLSDAQGPHLLKALDEAVEARVVAEVPGVPGRLRFSHALIRDAFYEEIAAGRRIELHLRMCEVLEALYAPDLEPHLAELAYHAFEAAPGGKAGMAIDYARRAGDRALRLLAYEEAVRLQRMAIAALALTEPRDETMECELRIALGETQMRAGDAPAAKESFRAAADIARRLKLPGHLARAALGYGGRFAWAAARGDPLLVELLESALDVLGERGELRARLLARLAAALRDSPASRERRASLSEEAVAVARRSGDPAALAYALEVRTLILYGPDAIEERLALATEMLRLAETARDQERRLQAHHWRLMTFWELGDAQGLKAETQAQTLVALELRQPAQLWYTAVTEAMQALFKGRFKGAEGLIARARDLGARAQSWNAEQSFWLQTFALRRDLGDLQQELEADLQRLIDDNPTVVYWRCALALLRCELGRDADARSSFQDLAAGHFRELPRDEDWLMGMTLLAEVCAHLGDVRSAGVLYEILLPYAGRIALSPPNVSTGSLSRSLGLLSGTLSRWDEAEQHLGNALEAHTRMGARPWIARTLHDLGKLLLRRDGPADRQRALELFGEAFDLCRALGMAPLEKNISTQRPPRLAADANVFRREGEYWSVEYAGKLIRLKDARGLRYMARLLREPGREFHALDLAAGGALFPAADAGALLDAKAKAAYRQRLTELDEEGDRARSWADQGRTDRVGAERDFLVRELARAVGLGGRDRAAASAAERARINVTRAVKSTLLRLREHNPALGLHFDRAVRTGMFCAYEPDPLLKIRWSVHSEG